MAPTNQPSMTYHGQEFRVRVEITRAHALESAEHPAELVKRARLKMEALLNEGKVVLYEIFEQKLIDVWAALRNSDAEPPTTSVSFTLAAGSPLLIGLDVEKGPNEKAAILITVAKDANRKTWIKESMRATILCKAKELNISEALSMAQVQACITRIVMGDAIVGYPIPLLKAFPTTDLTGKMYGILANKARGEIAVIVNDLKALQQQKNQDTLIQTIEKLKQQAPGHYRYHRQDMLQCLSDSWKGTERIGVGMPMTILAVTGQIIQSAAAGVANTPKYIEFKIAPNRMTAQVVNFKPELFTDSSFKFSRESFLRELQLSGINYGLTDAIWMDIELAWNSRESLNGYIAAEGIEAVPGADPYIHLTYKDAPEIEQTAQIIDLREAQQRTLVHAGQLVGELRYNILPVPGKAVTGQVVHAVSPAFDIKLGDGITQREPGKYYATEDGIPIFEDNVLMVNKTYVHAGDVDLKSGNVRFAGAVEIKGSIDSGAVVDVVGPLTILGMIRGGYVHSKLGITVKQGIVTTDQGLVKSGADIKAEFIENSRVECEGMLIVNKAILNSQVFVGRSIEVVASDGVVGGGIISCHDALISQNIGFPSGARTNLIIGADARTQKRVTTCKHRVERLKIAYDKYKLELRELQTKRDAQLTPKHKERKKKLAILVNKARNAIEHAEKTVLVAQSKVVYNSSAVIAAYNRLSTNCHIELGGNPIQLDQENLGVALVAKKKRDSHICAVEDVKVELDRLMGRNAAAPSAAKNPKKVS